MRDGVEAAIAIRRRALAAVRALACAGATPAPRPTGKPVFLYLREAAGRGCRVARIEQLLQAG